MIIITGLGRSGTSALAKLYRELGFDPGGGWTPEVNAGAEHPEFYPLNNKLAAELGMSMVNPLPQKSPAPTGRRSRQPFRKPSAAAAPKAPRVSLAKWKRFDEVVARHRDTMVELAARTPVVKDPRFAFTLPLWLAAGAPIEHVTITMRAMSDIVASRSSAGLTKFTPSELRNSLTYGLGMIVATVTEHDVSHAFVKFPDFISDPEGLYAALRFPEPVPFDRFAQVAGRVLQKDQVHDWSAAGPATTGA
jgi:hypothetical protein